MSPIGSNNLQPTPPIGQTNINAAGNPIGMKKKKKHAWIWITLSCVLVLLVTPIALVYGFGYDNTHTDPTELNINPNLEGEVNLFEYVATDMFDDTNKSETEHNLGIGISQDNINQMLYQGYKSFAENMKKMVPAFYFLINEDEHNYTIVVELSFLGGIFKTNVKLTVSVETVTDPVRGVKFKIDNITIGRAGFLTDLLMSISRNFMNDESIQSYCEDNLGLHVESHLQDKYIFYSLDNLITDLDAKLDVGQDISFFKDFITEMLQSNRFQFDFYSEKKISSALSLIEFHKNDLYSTDFYYNDLQTAQRVETYLIPMLNAEIFHGYTMSELDEILAFLSKGYNRITDNQKDTVNHYRADLEHYLNMTIEEYTILQEERFRGTLPVPSKPVSEIDDNYIEQLLAGQITDSFTDEKIAEIIMNHGGTIGPIIITEENCHDILKASEAIGFGHVFHRLNDDGVTYKANYFMIDNFYLNIVDDTIVIDFGLDVNGYETNMMLFSHGYIPDPEFDQDPGKVYFDVDPSKTYFGNYQCSEQFYRAFIDYAKAALPNSSSNSWFTFDSDHERFVVNFMDTIEDNPKIQEFWTNYGSEYKMVYDIRAKGTSYQEPGYLEFYIDIMPR